MNADMENGSKPTPAGDEKKHLLYLKQIELLDTFLDHGTISPAQYEKSLHDLTVKMGEVKNVCPADKGE